MLSPACASAQWHGWAAYWENDTWVPSNASDDAFTNGLRLVLGRASGQDLPGTNWFQNSWPLQRKAKAHSTRSSLVVGHNMFTPYEITDYVPDPNDRPFMGLFYLGARYDITESRSRGLFDSRLRHSLEFDLGVMGPAAGGHPVQSAVHSAITTHRIPKGWPAQVDNTLAVSAMYMAQWKLGTHFLDVIPHGGLLLGTVQTYPFAGLTARMGWNMSGFPAPLGRMTAARSTGRPDWEIGVLAGVEGRYFVHNAPVRGSMFDPGDPGIDGIVRGVGDYRAGFFLRLIDWRLSYTFVRRSPEVAVGTSADDFDNYGSIEIAYEPRDVDDDVRPFLECLIDCVLSNAFDSFVLEAGIGDELWKDVEGGVRETHAMHVSVGRGLGGALDDFDLLFTIDGLGREFGPAATAGGDHFDRMLINKMLSVRYRIPHKIGPGQFHIRLGAGWATMEYEATPPLAGPRTTPCVAPFQLYVGGEPGDPREKQYCIQTETGLALSGALGYTYQGWPFDEVFGFNTEFALNRNDTDEARTSGVVTAGFRWTPR